MPKDNLTPRQHKVIAALLAGASISEAAQQVGVSRETIYEWKRTHRDFNRALQKGGAVLLDNLSQQLTSLGQKAIQTLGQLLDDPATPAYVKIRAADILVGRMIQLRELTNVERRLTALEEGRVEKL